MDLHYFFTMSLSLEVEAALTAQNQITVPAPVRKVLGLEGGKSRIRFQVLASEGRVYFTRVETDQKKSIDPALKPFLLLLEKDLRSTPERIIGVPASLLTKARSLVKGVKVNLDEPLVGED